MQIKTPGKAVKAASGVLPTVSIQRTTLGLWTVHLFPLFCHILFILNIQVRKNVKRMFNLGVRKPP